MREILFRGKRVDNGEWVYGSFCMDALEQKNGLCGVDGFIRLYDPTAGKMQMHEVDRETVGQYTGKDLCGEKLFEGDVIESVEDYDDKFGYPATSDFFSVVLWDEKNLCWAFKTDGHIQAFNDWTWENSIKVGNIHDNPELLEG